MKLEAKQVQWGHTDLSVWHNVEFYAILLLLYRSKVIKSSNTICYVHEFLHFSSVWDLILVLYCI